MPWVTGHIILPVLKHLFTAESSVLSCSPFLWQGHLSSKIGTLGDVWSQILS